MKYRKILWSGFIFSVFSSLIIILFSLVILKVDFIGFLIPDLSNKERKDAVYLFLIFNISNALGTNISGMLSKGIIPFGYNPRMVWWGVIYILITNFLPVLSICIGNGLIETGYFLLGGNLLYHIIFYSDLVIILKNNDLLEIIFSFKTGIFNYSRAFIITIKDILENFRQQGVRLILSPLSGTYGLVAFTTLRTGANVVLQGLSTITNPIMPELLRFLYTKEQEKFETSVSTVWIVVVAVMCPGVLIIQSFIEPLFLIWTQNKILFDPALFAMLSLGVIIFGIAQPAMAIVTGNNLLTPQIIISLISTCIVVGSMFILVPKFGIIGAGFSLLSAEIISLTLYQKQAKLWLTNNSLIWPSTQFRIAIMQAIIVSAAMILMIMFYDYKYYTLIISLIMISINIRNYWQSLPTIVIEKVYSVIDKLPIISLLVK